VDEGLAHTWADNSKTAIFLLLASRTVLVMLDVLVGFLGADGFLAATPPKPR
jgi:hypothetical protein